MKVCVYVFIATHSIQYTCYKWDQTLSPGFPAVMIKREAFSKIQFLSQADKKKKKKKKKNAWKWIIFNTQTKKKFLQKN